MFSTILFDIDGTIIDTEDVIISSLQEAVSQVTGRQLKHADLQFTLGIPSSVALKQMQLTPADQQAVQSLWAKLLAKKQKSVRVFATMRRTLAHLQHRGVKLGIITSKNDEELEHEFNRFGLNDYFDVLVTADAKVKPKPSGEPIAFALHELNSTKRDTLYVGDSRYDLQSAQDAGVSFAVATWGANDLSDFGQADYMLMQPESILDLAVIK